MLPCNAPVSAAAINLAATKDIPSVIVYNMQVSWKKNYDFPWSELPVCVSLRKLDPSFRASSFFFFAPADVTQQADCRRRVEAPWTRSRWRKAGAGRHRVDYICFTYMQASNAQVHLKFFHTVFDWLYTHTHTDSQTLVFNLFLYALSRMFPSLHYRPSAHILYKISADNIPTVLNVTFIHSREKNWTHKIGHITRPLGTADKVHQGCVIGQLWWVNSC